MIAVPVPVDNKSDLFAWICRSLKPAGSLDECCVVNPYGHGYVRSEDRQREGLPVNRRGMCSRLRLRSRFDNRGGFDRLGYRWRGIGRADFPWADSPIEAGAIIRHGGNGIVVRFIGLYCLRGEQDRIVRTAAMINSASMWKSISRAMRMIR